MAGDRFVAVVGARALPEAWAAQVAEAVAVLLGRGWGIGSGGARGADQYALQAVVAAGAQACTRSAVFLPGAVPAAPGGALGAFVARGGRVVGGVGAGRAALLARSRRLARASSGVVAFLWGPSRGSVFTVREAARAGRPVAVVLAGGGAQLPALPGGGWQPLQLGGLAAFRWAPGPQARRREDAGAAPRTSLRHIFAVPDGEPTEALLAHIASLTQGDRLWFEHAVLVGRTVVVPHEVLSDTPAWLTAPALRRRFACTLAEASGLGELFLALEAGPDVVAHYEAEARRGGAASVIEDLVHLVAGVALVEPVPDTDALDHAERLGEWDEALAAGDEAEPIVRRTLIPLDALESVSPVIGWHAIGSIDGEQVRCAACGSGFAADDDAAETPRCPGCGTHDTWEARQGAAFVALVAEIDGCPSLEALAPLGRRLYTLGLPRAQAGVAWSHYQLRKAALEAAVVLAPAARALVARVNAAPASALARLGARLYRLQRSGAVQLSGPEWRRVWRAYQARRRPAAA